MVASVNHQFIKTVTTTTQIILQGGVFLLTGAVTKFNRLSKCLRLMEADFFLFTKANTLDRLLKLIYGGGHIKTTASKNHLFSETVILKQTPQKIHFQRQHPVKPASTNSGPVPSPSKSPHLSSLGLIYQWHLGLSYLH